MKSDEKLSLGQRIADRAMDAFFSWYFILSFVVTFTFWVVINSFKKLLHPFDPFPYILLNLALSFLAAIQAPLIGISQKRRDEKSAQIDEGDYNLDAETNTKIKELEQKITEIHEVITKK